MGMSTASLPDQDATPAPSVLWQDHDHRGHVVQFYTDDTFLLDTLSRFIGTALGGDAAIVGWGSKGLEYIGKFSFRPSPES
jgi:hypothetical protein